MEIVGDLRQDPGPVNGIDGCQCVGSIDIGIGKQRFDDILSRRFSRVRICHALSHTPYLAVVERALDGQVMDVRIGDSCHLRFLDRADFALGMQNEDGYILFAS